MDVYGRSGITPGQWKSRSGQKWSSGGTTRSADLGGRSVAGGAKNGAFLTGDKELDELLAVMEPKHIRPAVVKATDATITNYVRPEYIQKITSAGFVETGATRDIAKKRRVKRSRMHFGSELFIDRQKVVELRLQRGGRIGYDKKRNEDFFHPIAIEFGTPHTKAEHPLRDALVGNTAAALAEFRKYLRAVITGVKLAGLNYGRRFKL